jgi:hypothetical protein
MQNNKIKFRNAMRVFMHRKHNHAYGVSLEIDKHPCI